MALDEVKLKSPLRPPGLSSHRDILFSKDDSLARIFLNSNFIYFTGYW
jgi:hypothetical protein